MDFYQSIMCPNCDEEAYYGICRTYSEYEGLPVVSPIEQESFEWQSCHKKIYIGELDVLSEDDV
jgi:hypothetical protein